MSEMNIREKILEPAPEGGMTLVTAWTVKCVTCGRDVSEDSDWAAWPEQAYAREQAEEIGYELVDGSWYCEDHAQVER